MTASPGYFAAAGIDLIAGRYFTEDDTDAGAAVIIVSENPAIISGVAIVIVAVAVLVTWIPAARATRIDPALTLRAE